jgi:hypothetical protein
MLQDDDASRRPSFPALFAPCRDGRMRPPTSHNRHPVQGPAPLIGEHTQGVIGELRGASSGNGR